MKAFEFFKSLISNRLFLFSTPLIISSLIFSYYLSIIQKKNLNLKDKLEKEKQNKLHEQKKCEEQRLGRTRAERELRRVINSYKEDRENKNVERPPDYPPIGFLESCFRERNGTPRQGLIVTKGKALLKLKTSVNPTYSLEGLEQYSHCWLIFIFHENTNTLRSVRSDRPASGVKAKVAPPRLDGIKVGLFSTRTPHRPNPIGLSVAKIDKVVGDTIYLSGIDLIDGTPILDVKPYSVHDCVQGVINPAWVTAPVVPPLDNVIILDIAKTQLMSFVNQKKLKFYDNYEDIELCIVQILTEDIRSVRKRKQDKLIDQKLNNKKINNNNNNNNKESEDDNDNENNDSKEKEEGPEKHRFSLDILNIRFTVENQVATVFEILEDQVLGSEDNIYQPSSIYNSNNNNNNNNNNDDNNDSDTKKIENKE